MVPCHLLPLRSRSWLLLVRADATLCPGQLAVAHRRGPCVTDEGGIVSGMVAFRGSQRNACLCVPSHVLVVLLVWSPCRVRTHLLQRRPKPRLHRSLRRTFPCLLCPRYPVAALPQWRIVGRACVRAAQQLVRETASHATLNGVRTWLPTTAATTMHPHTRASDD